VKDELRNGNATDLFEVIVVCRKQGENRLKRAMLLAISFVDVKALSMTRLFTFFAKPLQWPRPLLGMTMEYNPFRRYLFFFHKIRPGGKTILVQPCFGRPSRALAESPVVEKEDRKSLCRKAERDRACGRCFPRFHENEG